MNNKKLLSVFLAACMLFSTVQPVIYARDSAIQDAEIRITDVVEDTENLQTDEIVADETSEQNADIITEETAIVDKTEDAEDAVTENIVAESEEITESAESADNNISESNEELTGEETDTVESETENTFIFNGMPEDYVLTEEESDEKMALAENDVISTLEKYTEGTEYIAGQVSYYYSDSEKIELVANAYNAEVIEVSKYYAVFELPEAVSVYDAMVYAVSENNVPAVSPRYIYNIDMPVVEIPDNILQTYSILTEIPEITGWEDWGRNADPYINLQWVWNQWHMQEIGVFEAWGTTQGSSDITVAVIDSGIVDTEDMDGKEECLSPDGTASAIEVISGHGTHVAGIIGANYNNDMGGSGIAPGVNLLNYQVTNSSGSIVSDYVNTAVYTAVAAGADVINMSFGGPFYTYKNDEAIQYAIDNGVVVVAAAGNDGSNIKNYPAEYDDVISVEALTPSRETTYFSTYGAGTVSAPGEEIISTYGMDSQMYAKTSGTSQAAPVVTGVIALYMSVAGDGTGDVNNDGVRNRRDVKAVADAIVKTGEKTNTKNASKMISAAKLLASVIAKPVANAVLDGNKLNIYKNKITDPVIIEDGYSTAAITFDITDDNDYYIAYSLDGKLPKVKNGILTNGITYEGQIDLTQLPDGKYKLRAVAVNGSGVNSAVTSVDFEIKHSDSRYISVTGPAYVAKGKSVTFKAALNTIKGSINWTIDDDALATGVKISSKGILAIPAAPSVSKVTVTAYVKGNEKTKRSVEVYIKEPTSAVTITGIPEKNTVRSDDVLQLTAVAQGPDASEFVWSTSNKAIVAVDENGVVTPLKKGTVTITAAVQDGTKQKASVKLKIAQVVTDIEITAPTEVVTPGSNYLFTANVYPAGADNKNVIWSVTDKETCLPINGIRFDTKKKNQLKISSDVDFDGYITVTATAADGSGVVGTKDIRFVSAKATGVTLSTTGTGVYKGNKLVSVNMYRYKNKNDTIRLAANVAVSQQVSGYETPVVWTSSKPSVAVVDQNGVVTVTNNGTGKVTVTATAADGSGKKASVTINVVNGLYEFAVKNDNTLYLNNELNIPKGGSYKFETVAKDITGKSFKTSVTWSIENNPDPYNIKISGGKITVGTNADFTDGDIVYVVACSAANPENGFTEIRVPVILRTIKATKIDYVKVEDGRMPNTTSATMFITDVECSNFDFDEEGNERFIDESLLNLEIVGYYGSAKTGYTQLNYTPSVTFTNSSTKYADLISYSEGTLLSAKASGSYKITAKTADGTGKKAVLSVKNSVPASQLIINSSNPEAVFIAPGKSIQLKADLGEAYGKPTNQKIKWELGDTGDCKVTLSSSGKLTVKKSNDIWSTIEVFAYTTDGSNLKDVYEVSLSGSGTSFIKPYNVTAEQILDSKGRVLVPANSYTKLFFTADTLGACITLDSIIDNLDADIYNLGFKVSSSNIKRSGVSSMYGGISVYGTYYYKGYEYPVYQLTIIGGTQTGESKITVTTRDGTNKKITFKVYTY